MARERSRFPGMDPWLEDPRGWRGIHAGFVSFLHVAIARELPPRYYARTEDRVYIDADPPQVRMPDVRSGERSRRGRGKGRAGTALLEADPAVVIEVLPETVEEHYLEIRDVTTGHRIVTVIEVLSPANKTPRSDGQRSFLAKQQEVLASDASLVEIDLLRGGEHVAAVPRAAVQTRCGQYHYVVAVRRAIRPDRREVYAIPLAERLPKIAIPLADSDPDVVADLQPILDQVYATGRYEHTIDYSRPPDPPLARTDSTWAKRVLARG